jgi:hypothetical protein
LRSFRVIKSGHIIEVYKYDKATQWAKDDPLMKRSNGGRDKEGNEERKMEYRESVNHKAREKLRRLINANFDENSLFITLTFREHVTDIEEANYNLKKFLQKMKRRYEGFAYVAVIEFTKKGRIHYHMLVNGVRLEWKTHEELQSHERDLADVWGHGYVDIGYKKNDNAGAYLLKYMTKEHIDERLEGKKRYFFSRNLTQPKTILGAEALEIIRLMDDYAPVFNSEYYNEFQGNVTYQEYNPKRNFVNVQTVVRENAVTKGLELFGDLVEVKE